jgi:hypothetical protein
MEDTQQEQRIPEEPIAEERIDSIESIVEQITEGLSDHDRTKAQNMLFLAVSTAVGWGICSGGFQQIFGLSPTQQEEFPNWVGKQLVTLATTDSD